MRPRLKDGAPINLYLDASVVEVLDAMSLQTGLSRSVLVERLVREAAARQGVTLGTEGRSLADLTEQIRAQKSAAKSGTAVPKKGRAG